MIILGMLGIWQILLILLFLSLLLIPIIALIDILRNEFTGNNKLIWILVVLLSNLIGAILYFIIGVNHKIKKQK